MMRARPTPVEAHGRELAAYASGCNRGINALGLPLLIRYFNTVSLEKEGQQVWISVGSGRGSIEALIAERCGLDFICVDPYPNCWQKEVEGVTTVEPSFPTVEALITERPELKGNCNLFLNWTPPGDRFDCEALKLLEPNLVMSIIESGGGSGSLEFIRWLRPLLTPYCAGLCRTFDFDRWGMIDETKDKQRRKEEPEKVREEEEYISALPSSYECVWTTGCQQLSSIPASEATRDLRMSIKFLNSANFWRYILLQRREGSTGTDVARMAVLATAGKHWDEESVKISGVIEEGSFMKGTGEKASGGEKMEAEEGEEEEEGEAKVVYGDTDSVFVRVPSSPSTVGERAVLPAPSSALEWHGLPLQLVPIAPNIQQELINNMRIGSVVSGNPFAYESPLDMLTTMGSMLHAPDLLIQNVAIMAQMLGCMMPREPEVRVVEQSEGRVQRGEQTEGRAENTEEQEEGEGNGK